MMQEDDSLDTVTFDYKAMDDLQYYLSDSDRDADS